jgi:hypothetical protein
MFDYQIGKKTENADEQEGQIPGIIIRRLYQKEAGCHLLQIGGYGEKGRERRTENDKENTSQNFRK